MSARKNPQSSTTVERRPLQRASVPAPQPSKASIAPSASTDIWPDAQYDWDEVEPGTYHDLEEQDGERILGDDPSGHSRDGPNKEREPRSALEHYEKAVERESQGSLGDSVSLYRRAFRVIMTLQCCNGVSPAHVCIHSSTLRFTKHTRTNTFRHPCSQQNLQIITQPMRRLRYLTPPTTLYMVCRPRCLR